MVTIHDPDDTGTDVHPNTVDIHMENEDGQVMIIRGESTSGVKARIVRTNQVQADFTGEFNAVIIIQQDKPGVAAHITKCLSNLNVNIAFMRIFRESKGENGIHHRGVRRKTSGRYFSAPRIQSTCPCLRFMNGWLRLWKSCAMPL